MIDISVNHEWNWVFARLDIDEMKEGKRIIYLACQNGFIGEENQKMTGCKTGMEYAEKYFEQIITHETIHLGIFDAFKDKGLDDAIWVTKKLDSFDNWGLKEMGRTNLNPISFAVCDERR